VSRLVGSEMCIRDSYPLDAHYKKSPQMVQLTQIKKAAKLS
jgi:hypothetical protein